MTVHELAARFGVTPKAIQRYRERGIIPPPYGRTRNARYGLAHVEAIEDYHALKHAFVYPAHALAFCREEGIPLRQYLRDRLQSATDNALGIG